MSILYFFLFVLCIEVIFLHFHVISLRDIKESFHLLSFTCDYKMAHIHSKMKERGEREGGTIGRRWVGNLILLRAGVHEGEIRTERQGL